MKKIKLFVAALVMCFATAFAQDLDPNREITVGFIYVGPVGDAGWTYAHDLGRQKLEEALPQKPMSRVRLTNSLQTVPALSLPRALVTGTASWLLPSVILT
jgi:basic membrane lipoprotein Med (substrate-binding protein (PBP1-ABC) superfamily)